MAFLGDSEGLNVAFFQHRTSLTLLLPGSCEDLEGAPLKWIRCWQVNTAVRIMETYMDFVTTASTLFRDLGGLTQMIARIDLETRAGSAPIPPSGGPETSAVAAALQAPAGQPGTAAGTVPYARRNLLKSLLRAVALASYSPGSGARPQARPFRTASAIAMRTARRSLLVANKDVKRSCICQRRSCFTCWCVGAGTRPGGAVQVPASHHGPVAGVWGQPVLPGGLRDDRPHPPRPPRLPLARQGRPAAGFHRCHQGT